MVYEIKFRDCNADGRSLVDSTIFDCCGCFRGYSSSNGSNHEILICYQDAFVDSELYVAGINATRTKSN